MNDLVFVVAAYGGILGAVAVYAVSLTRRLARARAELAGAAPGPTPTPSSPGVDPPSPPPA